MTGGYLAMNLEQYTETEKSIIELEKKLFKIAPEEVKKLYLEIDFLCSKQKNIELDLLIKY